MFLNTQYKTKSQQNILQKFELSWKSVLHCFSHSVQVLTSCPVSGMHHVAAVASSMCDFVVFCRTNRKQSHNSATIIYYLKHKARKPEEVFVIINEWGTQRADCMGRLTVENACQHMMVLMRSLWSILFWLLGIVFLLFLGSIKEFWTGYLVFVFFPLLFEIEHGVP